MSERTYSLREIAPILAKLPEARSTTTLRQVRHWTVQGLLSPVQRHTGRGRDRLYTFHEIRKAGVFAELSRYQMTVGLLADVGDWMDDMEANDLATWQFAKEARFRVYMEVGWSTEIGMSGSLGVHPDDLIEARKAARGRATLHPASVAHLSKGGGVETFSSIWINLTGLFRAIGTADESR